MAARVGNRTFRCQSEGSDAICLQRLKDKKAGTKFFRCLLFGAASKGSAIDYKNRLRTNNDVVANALDVVHATGNIFSLHFFSGRFCKAGQLHGSVERFNADGCR